MKKLLTFPNIQAVLFAVMTVVETLIMILYMPLHIGIILLILFVNLLFIASVRFTYQFAYWSNRWHSYWRRKNSSEEQDEPSEFIVGASKVASYAVLLFMQIMLLVLVLVF